MATPNVLLICTDHWSASLMGCAGNQTIMTPTLDQIAAGGIRFTNLFSTCPVCIPARRSLMTGQSPKTHGDRVYTDYLRLPPVTTMAQAFRDAGYQAYAVGKLHVYPQRDRIGFDDVLLCEEARYYLGAVDDYQIWLADHGYVGQEYLHGMSNNTYYTRPWHLPEEAHNTNWATNQMIRAIKRRNPDKPGFYYLSYIHPHPPLVPLQVYWDMYRDIEMPASHIGDWCDAATPFLQTNAHEDKTYSSYEIQRAKQAFYAQCTHIDNQIRLVIGTLREEGLLDNTVIGFTSDHGDMLFEHNLTAKRCFYQNAANVPFLLSGKPMQQYAGRADSRLACLEDVMPTLLDACSIPIPETVEGYSLLSGKQRDLLFGEISDGPMATRMATDGRFKLIYYPYGNVVQLFDLQDDPNECRNLADQPSAAPVLEKLTQYLVSNLHGGDEAWVTGGKLTGCPATDSQTPRPNYGLNNQRGGHWPIPPLGKIR